MVANNCANGAAQSSGYIVLRYKVGRREHMTMFAGSNLRIRKKDKVKSTNKVDMRKMEELGRV